jgi:molybdopterin-guanine dinucleotide biosynthesis protein A
MSAQISGFVLAGGRSSRMGEDKALVELGGQPLIALAVAKLRRFCAEVAILGANPELSDYAPLVPDLHTDCGPMGGIEAALAYAVGDWSMILPVDVPFLPESLLAGWIVETVGNEGLRLSLFRVEGRVQPTILLIHRDLAPATALAVSQQRYKLFPVLEAAAQEIAERRGMQIDEVLRIVEVSEGQRGCFANLNTPEDLALARASA